MSVTLYRAENPFWLTNASIDAPSGDLVIVSGDGDREWHLRVPAERKRFVLRALAPEWQQPGKDDAVSDSELLARLKARFAGDANPYDAIEAFLRATNNAPQKSCW